MKTSEIYLVISDLRDSGHAVAMLCELFDVSQSGYFASVDRAPSARETRRKRLEERVVEVFRQHRSRYGRPRIYRQLKAEGEGVSEKMIGSIISQQGLVTRKKRPFRPKTTLSDKRSRFAPDLLKDQPFPSSTNEVLVSDITYVATREGWLYLAGVMDLNSRFIKGYSIAERMPTGLISDALERALSRFPDMKGAILHSDRGCQYTSNAYLELLEKRGLRVSMSAKGCCYDNAAMESFWSTLKTECFPSSVVFETKEEAKQAIFEYIEGYYHTKRMHSSLDYQTPMVVEKAA